MQGDQLRPSQAFGFEAAVRHPQLFQRNPMRFRSAFLAFRLDVLGDERVNQAADRDRRPLFGLLGDGISAKLHARVSAPCLVSRSINGQRSEAADLETALGDGPAAAVRPILENEGLYSARHDAHAEAVKLRIERDEGLDPRRQRVNRALREIENRHRCLDLSPPCRHAKRNETKLTETK